MPHIVLSYIQAEQLLQAHREGKPSAVISLDLGLTTSEVTLEPEGVRLPDGHLLRWEDVAIIRESERSCFAVEEGRPRKIQMFSEHTNRFYSLMPTTGAPTLLVSGFPMHRIKGVDPYQDTLLKLKTIAPVVGQVLDTATGLGYTAIEAAKTAEHVITIELDPVVLEMARQNPWSRALFNNPRITQIIGDSFEEVQRFDDAMFDRIIHDPPTISLAGELYSLEFYRRLFRVLKPGGRLFHYIGDLESPSGHTVARGVVRRLEEAGFQRILRRPEAFGLVAYKERR